MDYDQFNQTSQPEDPRPVISQENLLRPNPPSVTTFNKKTILLLGAVMGVVILFTTIAIMSPANVQQNNQVNIELEDAENKNIHLNTPDEINKIPGSYLGHIFGVNTDKNDIPVPILAFEKNQGNYNENPNYNFKNPNILPEDFSEANLEAINARKSGIRFTGSILNTMLNSRSGNNENLIDDTINSALKNQIKRIDVLNESLKNTQDSKQNFYKSNSSTAFYTSDMGLKSPLSKYEVKAGTVIPVTLITGINSDLPGFITAQVRTNIYDTSTGRYLLIPQGTKVIGVYDSDIAYAQNRLLVSWTRLILPNGLSLALEGMAGVDPYGYAGYKDKVNNHWKKIIGGAFLTSMLGASSELIKNGEYEKDYSTVAASGAAESLAQIGAKISDKNLNIQPTIEIRPGLKFNIFVDKDLILESYKE